MVEVVSPCSRKTDRFAEPGEYAEAGIPLFWRVETEPELLLVAHRLTVSAYEVVSQVSDEGVVPAPWAHVLVDLRPFNSEEREPPSGRTGAFDGRGCRPDGSTARTRRSDATSLDPVTTAP